MISPVCTGCRRRGSGSDAGQAPDARVPNEEPVARREKPKIVMSNEDASVLGTSNEEVEINLGERTTRLHGKHLQNLLTTTL